MRRRTSIVGADIPFAGTIPIKDNPIRKLMLGFLDPSEMTPEERMDELARILADGFLRLHSRRGLLQHRPPSLDRSAAVAGSRTLVRAARHTHNLKVAGSNPAPATNSLPTS